ncbi:hypothetical protein AB5J72_06190 [Streptomyces sp. CG1]|uniref:hypothetical protein n=1 Tax=Streptomyces sp. CG1 TaxID=1287523 RepID=UPI0034E1F795
MSSTKIVDALLPLLGGPVRHGEEEQLREAEAEWGVQFPLAFVEVAGAYGDTVICDYIFLCGARKIRSYAERMGRRMEKSSTVPCRVLPSAQGVLLWGNTVEGDQLFLIPRESGRWTVSAFRRNWHDWYDSDLSFEEWFPAMLSGAIETDWMPEWPSRPYPLELVD